MRGRDDARDLAERVLGRLWEDGDGHLTYLTTELLRVHREARRQALEEAYDAVVDCNCELCNYAGNRIRALIDADGGDT